jgi:hypothetical protein
MFFLCCPLNDSFLVSFVHLVLPLLTWVCLGIWLRLPQSGQAWATSSRRTRSRSWPRRRSRSELHRRRQSVIIKSISQSWISCWPCIVESLHLGGLALVLHISLHSFKFYQTISLPRIEQQSKINWALEQLHVKHRRHPRYLFRHSNPDQELLLLTTRVYTKTCEALRGPARSRIEDPGLCSNTLYAWTRGLHVSSAGR